MSFPVPVPGLVIRYSYLWRDEHLRGREEGVKDRPCAIILVTHAEGNDHTVTVLPVTHVPPIDPASAIEIPIQSKARLALDGERSWIILNEANRFIWPGPDLRPARHGDTAGIVYGLLPAKFYSRLVARFLQVHFEYRAGIVLRNE